MYTKKLIVVAGLAAFIGGGIAYASSMNPRQGEIQKFHPNHTHSQDQTIGAPEHSGGTDRYGCHNASVPYHCH